MKHLITAFLALLTQTTFAQNEQRVIDSLKQKYNKNVIGYARTVTNNSILRETITLFYTVDNEILDTIISGKVLIESIYQPIVVMIKTITPSVSTSGVFISGGLLGFMNGRKFIKLKPHQYASYAVPKWVQEIIEDNDKLTAYLRSKYGEYFDGTIK